jgi:hypothetical protein
MSSLKIEPGATVRFILESEALLGSHLSSLVIGRVDGESVQACSMTTLVPVRFETFDGQEVSVYVTESSIVSASHHPSGGLP